MGRGERDDGERRWHLDVGIAANYAAYLLAQTQGYCRGLLHCSPYPRVGYIALELFMQDGGPLISWNGL